MKPDPRKGNSSYYDLDANPLNDLPFYLKFVDTSTSILELGCGTGRVLIPLAAHCKNIFGIDYSQDMVDRCLQKLKENHVDASKATARVGDITNLELGKKFDLVIAPYRVMQALETKSEVDGFLTSIRRHLAPAGECILNVFQPNRGRKEIAETWCKPGEEIRWEKTLSDGARVVHSEWYEKIDKENMVLFPQLIYRKYSGAKLIDEFVQHIKMRCYWPDEFKALIAGAGFQISGSWGGYQNEEYGRGKELVLKFGL